MASAAVVHVSPSSKMISIGWNFFFQPLRPFRPVGLMGFMPLGDVAIACLKTTGGSGVSVASGTISERWKEMGGGVSATSTFASASTCGRGGHPLWGRLTM